MWNANSPVQVWTQFAMSISYDSIHYTTNAAKDDV